MKRKLIMFEDGTSAILEGEDVSDITMVKGDESGAIAQTDILDLDDLSDDELDQVKTNRDRLKLDREARTLKVGKRHLSIPNKKITQPDNG